MLDLIGAETFAAMLGKTVQYVSQAGKRAFKPGYRGAFLRPDANNEGRPLWIRARAEQYSKELK